LVRGDSKISGVALILGKARIYSKSLNCGVWKTEQTE
jgi:hypothetical protein